MEINKKVFLEKVFFPHRWAFTLLIPLRNIFLSPKKLKQRLQLEEHHKVLEVGPGPGYFSPSVAKAIPNGKLILADVQEEMLTKAKSRLQKSDCTNVEYHVCDGKTFPFENGSIDRIFLVTVLGEVENKDSYLKEFYRILHPNGIVSISEQWGDPDKMTQEELEQLFKKFGFRVDAIYGSKSNFTINFKKN